MKHLLTIVDETDSHCFESYRRIAEKLMNDYKLQVRDQFYRIVECEFYYNSAKHNDPYVHGHQRQKESCGAWYFHGSGLDITLSNGAAYGGVLIRGIARVKKESQKPEREDAIIGPLNVCTEIFKQAGPVLAAKPLEFGLVDISREYQGAAMKRAKVFAVPRVGLNKTKDSQDQYCDRPYRFISFLHLPHRGADKIKRYLTEDAKELINADDYKQFYQGKEW